MPWYDPFGWFLNPEDLRGIVLHCDNPQCHEIIQSNSVVYNRKRREIYHDGECHTDAELLRGFTSHTQVIAGSTVINHRYIDSDKAKRLLATGRLKQASKLEGEVV